MSPGMWSHVIEWIVPGVSRDFSAFIFWIKQTRTAWSWTLAQWHSVMSQKTWHFNNTALRTSALASLCLVKLPEAGNWWRDNSVETHLTRVSGWLYDRWGVPVGGIPLKSVLLFFSSKNQKKTTRPADLANRNSWKSMPDFEQEWTQSDQEMELCWLLIKA